MKWGTASSHFAACFAISPRMYSAPAFFGIDLQFFLEFLSCLLNRSLVALRLRQKQSAKQVMNARLHSDSSPGCLRIASAPRPTCPASPALPHSISEQGQSAALFARVLERHVRTDRCRYARAQTEFRGRSKIHAAAISRSRALRPCYRSPWCNVDRRFPPSGDYPEVRGAATMRRRAGSASLQWPCWASAIALSAVSADGRPEPMRGRAWRAPAGREGN